MLRDYELDPANNLTVTRVLVALVLTAALEFFNAVFKKSIRLRRDNPAMPNSVRACSIQVNASARTLGAFCLDNGSYAVQNKTENWVVGGKGKYTYHAQGQIAVTTSLQRSRESLQQVSLA